MSEINTTAELKKVLSSQFESDEKNSEEFYRYVIYVRKSTDAEDKQERSLKDQLAECEELVFRNRLRVVDVIEESMSAKEPDIRPKFRKMMADLQSGKYDGVIAWHPNRLARNMKEAGEIIDLLDKNIIKDLKFVAYTHNNDASGKMLLGITFVMSKQYSDHLSDSVLRGNRRSIEEGKYINKAKGGYKKDRNGYLRPDGDNFNLICEAFQMRLNETTLDEVAEYLNKNNYSRTNTRKGKTYIANATKSMLGKIMKDPIYAGVVVYGSQVEDLTELYDFVPAVSVSDFMKINKLEKHSQLIALARSYKRTGTVKADLLRGKVYCSHCGEAKLAGITAKKLKHETKNYFYYRCETDGCPLENKSTRAKAILDFAIKYFEKKPFSNIDAYQHYKKEMQRVKEQRMKETRELVRLKKSEQTKLNGRITDLKEAMVLEKDEQVKEYQKEDFQQTTDKIIVLTTEIGELESKIEAIKGTLLTYEEFLELFDNMSLVLAKTTKMKDLDVLLRKVFLNFTVNKKNVEEYILNEPFASLERLNDPKVSDCAR